MLHSRPVERAAFTLVELLVVMAVIGVLMGLILPAVMRVREAAAQTQCINHMKQIGLAAHQYHDQWGSFPPGHRPVFSLDGQALSGWLLSLLPYVEQQPLRRSACCQAP
jgi:prepilin-type N-terminal cleavage/methylation domain-containing protein